MELSKDQKGALPLLNSNHKFVCLKGYAGTGKTTTIVEWVKQASRPARTNYSDTYEALMESINAKSGKRVLFTAPTNKAARVLQEMCDEKGVPADCATIHSALKLKMQWQQDEQVLVPDTNPTAVRIFDNHTHVVIDECSMLNQEMIDYITEAQERVGNCVIFMGDPCQLPPINEEESESFEVPEEFTYELRKIMRQAGESHILDLGMYLRGCIEGENQADPFGIYEFEGNGVTVERKDRAWVKMLDEFKESDQDLRYLAWTNAAVNKANREIQKAIYGEDCQEFMPGEKVLTLKPVFDPIDQGVLYSTDSLLTLGSDCYVEDMEFLDLDEKKVHTKLKVWRVSILGDSRCQAGHRYRVVKSSSMARYKKYYIYLLNAAKSKKVPWRRFWDFVEMWTHLRPAYALTVHRSQGSTFDKVFVNAPNIMLNRRRTEMLQCLYVACTRPRSELVLMR